MIRLAVACLLLVTIGADDPKPRHRVLGADRGKLAILDADGRVAWEVENPSQVHDLALLPDGNILYQSGPATVTEISPEKKVVWSYTSKAQAPYEGPVEVHAVQRLEDGLTMIAETGNRRIIEVDRDGTIVRAIPLTIDNPHPHRDTRLARKLPDGHYLVCHEGDGVVREYDGKGKVVWSYKLDLAGRPRTPGHDGHGTEVFGALRKPDGNTIIACGNGNRVIEVNPEGKTVWSIERDELPGIKLAWVTSLKLLPNGNLVFGNCHAGPDNPQLIEVTRGKEVVWTLRDHEAFGNDLAAATVLDRPGREGDRRAREVRAFLEDDEIREVVASTSSPRIALLLPGGLMTGRRDPPGRACPDAPGPASAAGHSPGDRHNSLDTD